jgi:hypothetical protein
MFYHTGSKDVVSYRLFAILPFSEQRLRYGTLRYTIFFNIQYLISMIDIQSPFQEALHEKKYATSLAGDIAKNNFLNGYSTNRI